MLRLNFARAARRHAGQVRQRASDLVDQRISVRPEHQFSFLLHQPHLHHLGLCLDVNSVSLRAWRLLPLAPQVSQVVFAALIERKAVTLPLDHAFSFELADVGPAAIEMERQCRRADPFWIAAERQAWRGRAITSDALGSQRRGRVAHFRFRRA